MSIISQHQKKKTGGKFSKNSLHHLTSSYIILHHHKSSYIILHHHTSSYIILHHLASVHVPPVVLFIFVFTVYLFEWQVNKFCVLLLANLSLQGLLSISSSIFLFLAFCGCGYWRNSLDFANWTSILSFNTFLLFSVFPVTGSGDLIKLRFNYLARLLHRWACVCPLGST